MRHATYLVFAALGFGLLLTSSTSGRDLGSVPWKEFKQRSELVFEGVLVKAEMLGDSARDAFRYEYKVWTVFKGEAGKSVVFEAPGEEDINKTVGRIAIVALRKAKEGPNKDAWVLSIDERSCWRHENKMGADFHGVPVFDIPATLLSELPAELSEEVVIRNSAADMPAKTRVYPMKRVEERLKALLAD